MSDELNDYEEEAVKDETPVVHEVIPYSEDELIDSLKEEPEPTPKKPVVKKHVSWQLFRK